MSAREGPSGPSLTPFLPKATFTSAAAPIGQGDIAETPPASLTATLEGDKNNADEQETDTPSQTLTFDESTSTVTFTLAPSASLYPGASTYTLSPPTVMTAPTHTSQPANTAVPGNTPVSTDTTVPENTIVPPSIPVPSNTPFPSNTPVDTSTPVPTHTSIPVGCSPSGNASYESQVITLINQKRANNGLSPLTQNSNLRTAARRHSEDMACNDFFSHTGSDGSTLSSRIVAAGYSYSWAAENIAASSSCSFSASSVVNMWMNSSGHKANILAANAVHIGVGFRCVNDGTSGDLDAYYTADFGKP